jgi:Tripartite tricarboxylate transporter TctB family
VKIRGPAIFSICALIFFIVWVYVAQEWRLQARLYPWAIGFPMVILAVIQVILDLRGFKPTKTPDGTPMDFQFTKEIDPALAKKRAIVMFTWFFCFLLGVWLVGFPISIVVMMFSYLKIQSKESWGLSIGLTVIAYGFFWLLFVKLLTLPFPEGRIFAWLGWE